MLNWEEAEGDLVRIAVEDGWIYSAPLSTVNMIYVPASKKTLSLRAIAEAGPRRVRAGD